MEIAKTTRIAHLISTMKEIQKGFYQKSNITKKVINETEKIKN